MKVASLIFGMAMWVGFKIETTLPDWMELMIVVVYQLCATTLIVAPLVITFLEDKKMTIGGKDNDHSSSKK